MFKYGHDNSRHNDTVVIGSSNITRNGVQVAVDWNVLLRRKSEDSDASRIINEFEATFNKYLESPYFQSCLQEYRVDFPHYQSWRAMFELVLLSDGKFPQKDVKT